MSCRVRQSAVRSVRTHLATAIIIAAIPLYYLFLLLFLLLLYPCPPIPSFLPIFSFPFTPFPFLLPLSTSNSFFPLSFVSYFIFFVILQNKMKSCLISFCHIQPTSYSIRYSSLESLSA